MITNSRESDFTTKQEKNTSEDQKIFKASSSSSTSWSRLRSDPRIVRVSRAFGGKDRHSKVCTVRGLRDRRVRLSVPTAIQLYDLQDRLGLNQPSKVVDWLLNATKHEIDELPPLQIPPGNFTQNHQLMLSNSQSKEGLNLNNNLNWDDHQLGLSRSSFWSSDATNLREKSKEVVLGREDERENWKKREEEEEEEEEEDQEKQGGLEGNNISTYGTSNFFPRPNNHSSLPSFINNFIPQNSFYRLDHPSNFPFSHLVGNGINAPQTEDLNTCNVVPFSLPSGSQVLFCPPQTTQPYFPSNGANSMEFDSKQINHFQMFSSNSLNPLSSSTVRPFHLSMTPKLFPSQNNNESQRNKEQDFPPK